MAHTSIQPDDGDDYVAGNSIDVRIQFLDKNADQPEPITEDRHVEFVVKEESTTDDEEAIVHKSSEETGADGGPEITVDDESLDDGECLVHILKDDTKQAIADGSGWRDEVVMWFRADLFEGDHRVVSAVRGDWPMISA